MTEKRPPMKTEYFSNQIISFESDAANYVTTLGFKVSLSIAITKKKIYATKLNSWNHK